MTARRALGALNIFGTPLHDYVRPRLLFPKFVWAFVPIEPMNVRTKFEVRSFTPSSYNKGSQKIWKSLYMPTLPFLRFFNGGDEQ